MDIAYENIGNNLAGEHLEGTDGSAQQVFHCSALALACHRQSSDDDEGHGQDDSHQAGNNVEFAVHFRIEGTVDAELDGGLGMVEVG